MQLTELVEKAVNSIDLNSEPLGSGADGIIYPVNEKVVLKLHFQGKIPLFKVTKDSDRRSAEKEFNIGQDLYQQGIQVPLFFGLFEPKKSPLNYWGILMERIHGVEYKYLPGKLKREAKSQFNTQSKLIRQLGYWQGDSYHDVNTLFDPHNLKLYLFDFVRWEKN